MGVTKKSGFSVWILPRFLSLFLTFGTYKEFLYLSAKNKWRKEKISQLVNSKLSLIKIKN